MTVYFVRTRHVYDSYADWYTLAELSGYATCYADEMDVLSDNIYIVNHFAALGLPGNEHEATARIILWQFEWHPHNTYSDYPSNVREIWTSDKWYAELVSVKYVPMGSHSGLALHPFIPKPRYDVALMMYQDVFRRNKLINGMRGLGLSIAPDGWGEQRHTSLTQAACMVHIHQHEEYPTVAPLRFAIAAAYSLPLLTETPRDSGIFGHTYLLNSDYAHLPLFVQIWVRRNGSSALADYGRALNRLLCHEHTFRHGVEAAL